MDRLDLAESLFNELDSGGVDYIHWKSNEHLRAALEGKTDLDLLVPPESRGRFALIVDSLGFMPMVAATARRIPGVESYLGFDEPTGSLLHLDVQYRLVLGEQMLKNHHLPVEDWVLEDAHTIEGVRVPAPERELTLLYVRAMLKTTPRQLVRSIVKGGTPIPERILREVRWLTDRVAAASLETAVASVDIDLTASEVADFSHRVEIGDLPWRYVSERRKTLRNRLRGYQRLPRHRAIPKRIALRFRSSRTGRRLGLGIPLRRMAGNAPVVAAVGADGSGKSRLTTDLRDWLGSKLEVRHVYFGQPKSGVIWKALNKPGSLARGRGTGLGPITSWTEARKWVWLAGHRRRLAQRARSEANSGVVVFAERYPVPEFESMEAPMDGPRLGGADAAGRRELAQYRAIPAPDLTLILDADIQVLRDRKLDLGWEEHLAKVIAVKALPPSRTRQTLDAGPPYERVLLEAKAAVWRAIRETR